jgi:hypothetical protein
MSDLERTMIGSGATPLKEQIQKILGRGRFKIRKGENPNNRNLVNREQYEEYYKFTIVRNPWARAFSWYKNVMRSEHKLKRMGITKDLQYRDFLREYVGKISIRPQTYWLKSLDGSINLDFIGRFETLRDDFQKACNAMNLSGIELPHEVRGSGESYVSHYDEESIQLISDAYREEIEWLGYSFGQD